MFRFFRLVCFFLCLSAFPVFPVFRIFGLSVVLFFGFARCACCGACAWHVACDTWRVACGGWRAWQAAHGACVAHGAALGSCVRGVHGAAHVAVFPVFMFLCFSAFRIIGFDVFRFLIC